MDFPGGFTAISPFYRVLWGDEPVRSPGTITFHLKDEPPPGALIYAGEIGGGWHCLSSQMRGKNFSARLKGSGCVAVLVDNVEPIVTAISPKPGSLLATRHPVITVRVKDGESGLEGSDSIALTLDKRSVYGEYIPAKGIVRYAMRKDISSGRHEVQAKVTDRAGNTKSTAWRFTVR